MIPVLVTGGAGYVGSHTTKILANSGFEPVVFDNLSEGHASAVRWGALVRGDLGDISLIRQVIVNSRVEAVIHFAASAYVGESVNNPRKYFRNNVANALNLLDAALDSGVKYFVFSSTCAIYGLPERIPIPEGHPQHPVSPYGESKLFVERALHWYGAAYGLNWLALRYFNAAGADPEAESGEHHDPETHLIPVAILAALGHRPALEIYGTDYPTPDGTAIRDYVHVSDLAEAHVLALRYLMEGGRSTALNVGTGRGYSVREVIAAVERISGLGVPTREVSRRAGDPAALIADATMARRLLGWRPRFVELGEIIGTAWQWHASRAGARELPVLLEKQGISIMAD